MSNNDLIEFEKVLWCKDNVSSTISRKLYQLKAFLLWVEQRNKNIVYLQRSDIHEYLMSNFKRRDTRIQNMQIIREYFDFCIEKKIIIENPASEIEFSPERKLRTYNVPSYQEIQLITDRLKKTDSMIALRDFIMIEIAYGSGARAGEIEALNIEDINMSEKTVLLKGKGRGAKKERIVPLTGIACRAIQEYVSKRKVVNGALFVSKTGKRMTKTSIYLKFKICSGRNPHAFRHAFATHLLINGCSFKDISQMLGHNRPSTTAIYTHIPVENIREKVNLYHPRKSSICLDLGKENHLT